MRVGHGTGLSAGGPVFVDAKFAVPIVTHVVPRPRLLSRMTGGLERSCTLIAAPAGWGKTLLASSWLAEAGPGRAVGWISLGPAEDDVRAFWTAVATALAPLLTDRGAAALRRMVVEEDVEQLPGQFAGVLGGEGTPMVLALDNLHEVTSSVVHESLLRLIQRPPGGLHFVVTTRRDPPWPLHQLRLAGVLTEIRAADLSFGIDETAELFAQLQIDLDAERLGRLVERTEGWAAGLRLAALDMQGAEDPAGFVDRFSGDDHAVAAYLLSEVIDTLTPELLDFLVRVSFVDIVSAGLADALTDASNGAATLAELARSNLFVQAVGPRGQWYRLHRLIADVLRARVSDPRTLRDIHRRAAEWYRQRSMPLDAIRYALRGGLWSFAADLAGVHLAALVLRGSAREFDVLLSAVPRDVLLSHPELAGALAGARIMQGAGTEVGELMTAASNGANGLASRRAKRLRLLLDLMEMGHARFQGRLAAVTAAASRIPDDPRTLAGLGLAAWDVIPLLALSNAGTAELWLGDDIEAEKHLSAATETSRWGGVLRPHLNATAHLALLQAERGDLPNAQADAQRAVEWAIEAGWPGTVQIAAAYLALARVALDQDEPAEAERWLARVNGVESTAPEPHIQLAAAGLTALRLADAGSVEGALAGLRATMDRLWDAAPPVLADRMLLSYAELLRRAGALPQAAEVLAGLRRPATATATHALARLELAAGEATAAERTLSSFPLERGTPRERIDGVVLRVLIGAPQNRDAALRSLEDALLAAAPLGMRRPFLIESADLRSLLGDRIEAGTGMAGFALDLLHRMSGQQARPAPPTALVDALTEREQVVLRYLGSTLSNAEIARHLYLSVNTVKTHQRMIYRKLGADGRRDAVRRAKDLHLL